MASTSIEGIPLLSGAPPDPYQGAEPSNCRRCNKEFNFLFARPKRCNHCGYSYCSSCTDFQALMPRANGYDSMPVCTTCMDMLTITSSSRNRLKTLPLSKLRFYMKSYNILSGGAVEKDDLIDAIIRAKDTNGSLRAEHEAYYRNHAVPRWNGERKSRNIFSKFNPGNDADATISQSQSQSQSRPSPQPHPGSPPPGPPPQQRQYAPPPGPPPQQRQHASTPRPPPHQRQYVPPPGSPSYHSWRPQNPPHPQYPPHPHPPPQFQPQGQWNASNHPPPPPPPNRNSNLRSTASHTNLHSAGNQPDPHAQNQARVPPLRPRSAAPTVTPINRPPPPVPSLDELLPKTNEEIGKLSISTLKSILYNNRVNTSVGVLEKQDLVRKVIQLVTDERFDREIKERQEREEAERMEWARREREQEQERRRVEEQEREALRRNYPESGDETTAPENSSTNASPNVSERPQPSTGSEPFKGGTTDGLCVVCQDEHANMAIIDCGHLALCKSCSELIMTTSRECPLCRTRIVTEQRLLRIFRS